MEINWQANLWRKEFRFMRGKLIVGLLKKNAWSTGGYGEFNGSLLRFKQKKWWKSSTIILDIEGKSEIGSITYNLLKRSAIIIINDQTYNWKFRNWLHNSWEVVDADGSAVFTANNWGKKGTIAIDNMNPAGVLAAMYAREKLLTYIS